MLPIRSGLRYQLITVRGHAFPQIYFFSREHQHKRKSAVF